MSSPGQATLDIDPRQAIAPLILTLDIGTSSVRAMLFDAQARPLIGMEEQEQHEMRNTPDGGVETDPAALFDRTAGCIDRLLRRAGALTAEIGAVAPTTFWHNVIGVGQNGEPCTSLLTWADTRSAEAAAELRGILDPERVHARTGCVLHPSYLPAKLRWLQRTEPALREEVRYWMSFAEYLLLRLFGSPSCSISMASGSGLLDQHTLRWDEEVARAIPVDPARLSPLSDEPRRGLQPPFSTRWPALAQVPWYPGWGDGATSNVGSGCVTRGQVAMMVGTSGAMRMVWRPRRLSIPPSLWCYRVDAERVVMGGALSEGGNLLAWLHQTLAIPQDAAQLEAEVAAIEPDGHGLTVLPFLAGERSPGWVSEARATISGLSLHTTPAAIARAGMEAIAYRFGLIHELLHAEIPEARGVVASGGALLHSPLWLQMMADVLGYFVTASAASEASSRGAALLALEALGTISGIESIPASMGRVYTPDHARTKRYREGAVRQRALYQRVIGPA